MIYRNINRYNVNIITNYLNDINNFKTYKLFKCIDYIECDDYKKVVLGLDGDSFSIKFHQDDKIEIIKSISLKIIIDINDLEGYLISFFRDITIGKIITNG